MNLDNAVAQIRNFKDFLMLYHKISEQCFSRCVDNFYNRDISLDEAKCIDNCASKFTNVNHKILGVYIEVQQEINRRRVAEVEAEQAKLAEINKQNVHALAPESLVTDQKTDSDVQL